MPDSEPVLKIITLVVSGSIFLIGLSTFIRQKIWRDKDNAKKYCQVCELKINRQLREINEKIDNKELVYDQQLETIIQELNFVYDLIRKTIEVIDIKNKDLILKLIEKRKSDSIKEMRLIEVASKDATSQLKALQYFIGSKHIDHNVIDRINWLLSNHFIHKNNRATAARIISTALSQQEGHEPKS